MKKKTRPPIRLLLVGATGAVGQQVLQPEPLDVGAIATRMLPMLESLIGEDISLRIAIAPELRAVVADPVQIEQVVLNLMVNARDAMPHGGVLVIEIGTVALAEPIGTLGRGDYVRLAVVDTGVGMGPDVLARRLPSGLSPSVQEFHLVNRPMASAGSRTVTAGSELHRPRDARVVVVRLQCATRGAAGTKRFSSCG